MQRQLGFDFAETLEVAPPPAADVAPTLEVRVVRSLRRTLALHVSPGGRAEVRAPLGTAPREIDAFVQANRRWLLRKVAEFSAAPRWQPTFRPGDTWYLGGDALELAEGSGRQPVVDGGRLRLPHAALASPAACRRRLLAWHKVTAAGRLEPRTRELFALHCPDDELKAVEFRWMRATWGTCTARRRPFGDRQVTIRLNLWLGAVPPALADAVILHEIAHVAHMHHGPAFYRRLDRLDPLREQHDAELAHWARLLFHVPTR